MIRWPFRFLCVVSLLACAAVCTLWGRNGHTPAGQEDRLTWIYKGDRFTARSEFGAITLYGPPAQPRVAQSAGAAEFVGQLRNEHVQWLVFTPDPDLKGKGPQIAFVTKGPAAELRPCMQRYRPRFSSAELVPPLLQALEDPGRLEAAVYCLRGHLPPGRWHSDVRWISDDKARCTTPDGLEEDLELGVPATSLGESSYETTAHAVPACIEPVRDHYHRIFDVPIARMSYPIAVASTGGLPFFWLAGLTVNGIRRHRMKGEKLCASCGYDLRATPVQCPECGAAVAVAIS